MLESMDIEQNTVGIAHAAACSQIVYNRICICALCLCNMWMVGEGRSGEEGALINYDFVFR